MKQGRVQLLGQTAPLSERLLAEVSIKVELPERLHTLAVERCETLKDHIERSGSPLAGLVDFFYPQGSMATGSTIQSHKRSEGYDIDVVAELRVDQNVGPATVLDALFLAIRGEKGSRYYDMTKRQTRCVTVEYGGEYPMHIDVTPSMLLEQLDPRKSHIFHAKPENPTDHKRITINSFAFCEHFNQMNKADPDFMLAYDERAMAFDAATYKAAESKPVPEHQSVKDGKSAAVVALQLLKRNRNIRYAATDRKDMRMPPSVMLAAFACQQGIPTQSIGQALMHISSTVLAALEVAERENRLLHVVNPKCTEDCFTDRWPENRKAQQLYIGDLKLFRQQLQTLMVKELTLEQARDLLIAMFGETPARAVVQEYMQQMAAHSRSVTPSGRVISQVTGVPTVVGTARATEPRAHTFFGTKWKK